MSIELIESRKANCPLMHANVGDFLRPMASALCVVVLNLNYKATRLDAMLIVTRNEAITYGSNFLDIRTSFTCKCI